MTTPETPARPLDSTTLPVAYDGRYEPILRRVDLFAMMLVLLGLCLLAMLATMRMAIELVRLTLSLWSDSLNRWFLIVLGLALVWVVVRWKKSKLS